MWKEGECTTHEISLFLIKGHLRLRGTHSALSCVLFKLFEGEKYSTK